MGTVSDVVVWVDCGECWVEYTGTDGQRKRMGLDAETETDAVPEASALLDVGEAEIEVRYG